MQTLWILFVTGGAVWLLWYGYKHRWFMPGGKGEWLVELLISWLPDEYIAFSDVLIKSADGKTHQIDDVVLSPYGVFVIETKDYGGKIYGGYKSKYWKEYIAGEGYEFYNPIFQNNGHVRALMELFDLPRRPFYSVVVFTARATLKNKLHRADNHKKNMAVINIRELRREITYYDELLISKETLTRLKRQLEEANIQSAENRQKHIASLNS